MGRRTRYVKGQLRQLFAPVQPGEVPGSSFMGYKPNEADGGRWARCSVCGDLIRCRNEVAAFEIETNHWNTKHVG